DESTSSDPAQSMQVGPTSTDTMPRYYQHHHDSYPDEMRNANTGNSRKSTKRPLNVSPHLPINTKVYSKKSPQKRRPSDPNESSQRTKIHRTPDQMPYPSSGQKFSELREHPNEEQKPSLYLPPSQ
ncbi:6696_t:CDS:2, partial [Cetraspora pellucida]